jgi:hypothetical protein
MTAPHINQLRQHLLDTLADLRNRENPMEPDRARAVAQVASVLVDTAKVEVDYLKATGQDRAGFLEGSPPTARALARVGLQRLEDVVALTSSQGAGHEVAQARAAMASLDRAMTSFRKAAEDILARWSSSK